MLEFSLGERVCFQPDGRPPLCGVITRYNKKTVTIITDTDGQCNVAPQLLRKAGAEVKPSTPGNVITFQAK